MAVLTVFLDRIENLCDADMLGKSDPYVKFELEQDNLVFDKDMGDHKSSVKGGELNPEYSETFTFNIPDDMGLDNMVLSIKVMDDDPLKDDKIGSCRIKLEGMELSADPTPVERVVDANWFSKDAKIFLTLAYESSADTCFSCFVM